MKAKIAEIFKSIQGEGLYQGKHQVFIRFFGCNLDCLFCDTKLIFYKEKTINEVIKDVESYKKIHSICLTGGEPLLQVDFLKILCYKLKMKFNTIYLETNGILWKNLEKIINYIDIISMDFKLPSSTGLTDYWNEHIEFLRIAQKRKVFIKAVIGKNTIIDDILKSIEIIKKINPKTHFILQPQNPYEEILQAKLEHFMEICFRNNIITKIIPQLHKKLAIP